MNNTSEHGWHNAVKLLKPLRWIAIPLALAGLYSCGGKNDPDPASADSNIKAAYVVVGDGNQALARVATTYGGCPLININGVDTRMSLRVAAATVALRATASPAADSKPSEFPVNTCETALPPNATQVFVGSRTLPLPKAEPRRIVILADTGCRLKKADNAWQACSDAGAWPLSTIAAAAAGLKPDLVIHIGDYHYRENDCPADIAGCKGSPWGYGWDAWEADLFKPAAPLLAAAPWIVVRGNHEECARAGQGWFRFLDTKAYDSKRSCNEPSNDEVANYTAPYAVKLGADTQVIVFDSAKTGKTPLAATDSQFIKYQTQFATVAQLAAKPGVNSLFVNHHPILGFTPIVGAKPGSGNPALLSVLAALNPTAYYPAGIKTAMHGHVHDFQAINFSSNHPATFVTGNGGDNIDVSLPDPFPADASPAAGVTVDSITHSTTFGFMVMDRENTGWAYKAYARNGTLMATCKQADAKIKCDKSGYLVP